MVDLSGFDVEELSPSVPFSKDATFRCLIGRCEVIEENLVEEVLDHPLIDATEVKRFRVLRRRAEHVTARHLLFLVLQRWQVGSLSGIGIKRDENRAPHLIGWPDDQPPFISICHTNGIALVAVCTFPVGIDAEPRYAVRHSGLKYEMMSQTEVEILGDSADEPEIINRVWTAKEAIQKASGLGMRLVPATIPLVNRFSTDLFSQMVRIQDPPITVHVMNWDDRHSSDSLIVAVALVEPNRI
ncbi:MAG: hypothetical protein CL992_03555 [Euryarchaeota archaeon]|nr:hypothetical protein [Euryarchaeota archaeon]